MNRANKAGFTALHHAAQQGHLKVYRMLIQAGAEPNLKTNSNFTPIDIARRLGYVSIVEEHANDTDNCSYKYQLVSFYEMIAVLFC